MKKKKLKEITPLMKNYIANSTEKLIKQLLTSEVFFPTIYTQ